MDFVFRKLSAMHFSHISSMEEREKGGKEGRKEGTHTTRPELPARIKVYRDGSSECLKIIIIIIINRFLYSAFHIVSMRFTTDGGLFRAAYEGAYGSRAAYNHEELV